MTKSSQNIKTYIWATSIVMMCAIFIYFYSSLDTCYGVIYTLGEYALLTSFFIILTAFLLRQIYKIVKKAENSKLRFRACIIVIIASLVTFQGKSTWKNLKLRKSILTASITPNLLDFGRLELMNKEKYYILYGHLDWSCSFTGAYEKMEDTLILHGQVAEKTHRIMTNKYIITDSMLVPVDQPYKDMRRTETLIIEVNN